MLYKEFSTTSLVKGPGLYALETKVMEYLEILVVVVMVGPSI